MMKKKILKKTLAFALSMIMIITIQVIPNTIGTATKVQAATTVTTPWNPTWSNSTQFNALGFTKESHTTATSTYSTYPNEWDTYGTDTLIWYMYGGTSTSSNLGDVDSHLFTPNLALTAGKTYDLSFYISTNSTYYNLKNSALKIKLKSGASSTSTTLCDITQDVGINNNSNNNYNLVTFSFTAPTTTDGYYIDFDLTGSLDSSIYSCSLKSFSINYNKRYNYIC